MKCSPNTASLQSAYRALHSIQLATDKEQIDMLTAVDSKVPTALLSLDMSAAYDTLDQRGRFLDRFCSQYSRIGEEHIKFRYVMPSVCGRHTVIHYHHVVVINDPREAIILCGHTVIG